MSNQIQFIHTEKNENAEILMLEKIDWLKDKYSEIINSNVYFKEEKQQNEKNMICEVELSLPGPRIFAKANDETLEKAVYSVVDQLSSQLQKRKDQWKEH